ncbi:MAG TPA: hypothetical protein PLI60_00815 [Anaerolineaceae bacterium]|nr:hypothetical protein [Anaerolineaceae bacterium]
MHFSLTPPTPFSLYSVIHSHGWFQLAPFEILNDGQAVAYTTQLSTGKVTRLEIRAADNLIHISTKEDLSADEEAEVRKSARWMLSMDTNLEEFYEAAKDEPRLQKAIQKGAGRILRSPSLFEDVVKTILTTNTLWNATKSMTRKLVSAYGTAHPHDPNLHAFPKPEAVASVSEEELKETVRVGYRAPFIAELARRIADGSLDLEGLRTSQLPSKELRAEFLKIKGLGPYAAANLLMLLGRYDFLPIDSWALKMVSLEWHNGAPVKPADVDKAFSRWGNYKGLAYWLWDWTSNP